MELSERFSGIESNIAQVQLDTVINEGFRAEELKRPFFLLKPRVYPDGNQWCALLGENLQDGVAGFGYSPDAATRDFDRQWYATLEEGRE